MNDAEIAAHWDYGSNGEVVRIDEQGARVLACADTPGDQLKHLSCPIEGPCVFAPTQAEIR